MNLTLKVLNAVQPHAVFASGIVEDSPEGIFMTRAGGFFKWVAVKGGVNDWAIYLGRPDQTLEEIARHGDKLHFKENILCCVTCTDEVLSRYRG